MSNKKIDLAKLASDYNGHAYLNIGPNRIPVKITGVTMDNNWFERTMRTEITCVQLDEPVRPANNAVTPSDFPVVSDVIAERVCDYFLIQHGIARDATKRVINSIYGSKCGYFDIKRVIFSDPATIVFWADDTKTVVKAENEPFDPEKGLSMAIAKRALGNKGNYYEIFKKHLPKEEDKKEEN